MSRGRLVEAPSGLSRPHLVVLPDEPTLAVALRAALADAIGRLEANDPGARSGDVEAVHQLRVAFRRLRSDLVTLGDAVDPGWRGIVEPSMRWIAGALGGARDLDVLVSWLGTDLAHNPGLGGDVRHRLELRHSRAHADLHDALGDVRYRDLRGELDAALAMPPIGSAATQPAGRALAARILEAGGRLQRRAGALGPGSPDADFHRTRLAAKRVRYAADLTARLVPDPRRTGAARLAAKMAEIQGTLGDLQDAALAERELVESISELTAPAEAFEVGRLAERARRRADDARAAFLDEWPSARRRRWWKWAT